ncbi:MAG: type I-E CRISPR-associated protein Cas5/CasD [Thermoanaerobaculia bacterium]
MARRPFLILRLDAPLMSFGGVMVDQRGVTEPHPGASMVTGLLANALGFEHREANRLQRLQDRLRLAARCDRRGTEIVDYQTVDLSQDFLRQGWTTRGEAVTRGGGTASVGTHIRYRHYWANAVMTVAVELKPADEEPTLDDVEEALQAPERPLFLGRKVCLPSRPVLESRVETDSLYQALRAASLDPRADEEAGWFSAWWPKEGEPAPPEGGREVAVSDRRDWQNQLHAGRSPFWHARIPREEVAHGPS